MRKYLNETKAPKYLLLSSLLALSSCSSSQSMDERIYTCIEASYQEQGIDLSETLLEFETNLLKNGTLKATTGDAYYDMLRSVQTQENAPFEWDASMDIFLEKSAEAWYNNCLDELKLKDSLAYKAAKFDKLEVAINALEYHEVQTIMEAYRSGLSPSDFELPLYKADIILRLISLCRPRIPIDIPE